MLLWFALACTDEPKVEQQPVAPSHDTAPAETGPLRVVFMADSHVIGPQYTCCSESAGLDNDSIMHTPARLSQTIDRINDIHPPVDHVFLLGDVLHAAYHSHEAAWYQENETAFSVAADLLQALDAPLHILWGNHDYEVDCNNGPNHHSRALSHALFADFFGAEPYASLDDGGWRFLMLNSQLGPTWDNQDPKCDTELGSYGEEQLAWLDDKLSDNLPTFVMTHHHLLTSTAFQENQGPHPDLNSVLGRYDNVAVHMAGHFHRWYDFEAQSIGPVRHIILGSTRYDTDNFWLVEFDPTGEFAIIDYDKPQWNSTCADTWQYQDNPVVNPAATEEGDCGF